jgi:hypothetical protein
MIHDVAIIGGGLSGLAAARHLSANGRDVVIVEKSMGTGGRAATRRLELPEGGHVSVDHGAQFFTARDPLFRQQVAGWLARGVCFEWTSGFHTWDGASLLSPDDRWKEPRFACHSGMSGLGKNLAEGLLIVRGFRVGSVDRNGEEWLLHPTDEGSMDPIRARTLLCSAPVPQSLELTGRFFSANQQRLLGSLSYGSCLAVIALYRTPTHYPCWKGVQVRDQRSSLSWMAWDSSRRGRETPAGAVVLHSAVDFCSRIGLDSEEEKQRAAGEMLREAAMIGGEWIEKTMLTSVHFWRYAIPLRAGVEGGFLRSDEHPELYFLGDGLQGGRIEGAWLSGFKAAQDYLERHG